jgi:hypothetical protein
LVDLYQFDVEQLADALQVGAVATADVACHKVGGTTTAARRITTDPEVMGPIVWPTLRSPGLPASE